MLKYSLRTKKTDPSFIGGQSNVNFPKTVKNQELIFVCDVNLFIWHSILSWGLLRSFFGLLLKLHRTGCDHRLNNYLELSNRCPIFINSNENFILTADLAIQ